MQVNYRTDKRIDSRRITPPWSRVAPDPRRSLVPQTISSREDPPNNPQETSDKEPGKND